jgi:hypothetical protein
MKLMRTRRAAAGVALAALAATAVAAPVQAATPEDPDKVGVLITDWSQPEGFSSQFWSDTWRLFNGAKTSYPGEPCTQDHLGTFPFASQNGLFPFVLTYKTPGFENAFDSYGFYFDNGDGSYTNVVDESIVLNDVDIPDVPGIITPAIDTPPLGARGTWGLDPVTGENHFEGLVRIGAAVNGQRVPNTIGDVREGIWMAGYSDMKTSHNDLTPRLSQAQLDLEHYTEETLTDLYGDRLDVRFGAYIPVDGLTEWEGDVGRQMAIEGHDELVLTRETTDNNNYANDYQTLKTIDKQICLAQANGQVEQDVDYEQVRQVGRTPEYNTALLDVNQRHLDAIPEGESVAVVYNTYGLPWPGSTTVTGPFAQPHPWSDEVYHENAFNNYLSFKRYAEARWGQTHDLRFTKPGATGESRLDSYFSYSLYQPEDLTPSAEPEKAFQTLRQNIDQAKAAGEENIVVVLSHWYLNHHLTYLQSRLLNQIPLNTRDEIEAGDVSMTWCELPGASTPVDCATDGAIKLQYGEAFDDEMETFATGYGQRIRGGVERFGQLPESIQVQAEGAIDETAGGVVEVTSGELAGTKLEVNGDARPNAPEGFNPTSYETFTDADDNLVGAWDSYTGYIGVDRKDNGLRTSRGNQVGKLGSHQAVVGPYRTLSNQPMTVTIPAKNKKKAGDYVPYIWNDATKAWDPVHSVPGGQGVRVDTETGLVSFDTQVLGTFVLIDPR